MKKVIFLALVCAVVCGCNPKSAVADYAVVPMPRHIVYNKTGEGFVLDKDVHISFEPGAMKNAHLLGQYIYEATGLTLKVDVNSRTPDNVRKIALRYVNGRQPEGYAMTIDSAKVTIYASSPAGMFYGMQTLRKSLPVGKSSVILPAAVITDYPTVAWRGAMLDVARTFYTVEQVERFIDIMALHNLNTLHFHLSDDQGWRIESKKYPRLTEVGAYRKDADGNTIGGFYTREQIEHLVEYAYDRGIRIVPEIDLPGHMVAALAAYPQLGCTGGPYTITGQPGVMREILCGGSDEVMVFLKDILGEITELFPSRYIHIGGDEAPKYYWERCPRCQARIKKLELKTAFVKATKGIWSHTLLLLPVLHTALPKGVCM